MGNQQKGNIIIDIVIDKLCYSPGETINGYIAIKPKTYLNDSILCDSLIIIKLIQKQQYNYPNGEDFEYVGENSDLNVQSMDCKYFRGANVLLGINIPFSITIPLDIQPTLYFHTHYIKHCIYCEIPFFGDNFSQNIIIIDHPFFTLENQLLKIPKTYYKEFDISYNKKKGRMSCLFKLPKNSFTYFEKIPFEVYLDCTGFNGLVKSIKISIKKYLHRNCKDDHQRRFRSDYKEEMPIKHLYTYDTNIQKYEFKDFMQIPQNEQFDKICPKKTYLNIENTKHIYFEKMHLAPFCLGGLLSVEYYIKIEIFSKCQNEEFEVPIEIICDDNNSLNSPISQLNSDNKEKPNNIKEVFNINLINDDDNGAIDNFVVFEKDDFEKIYFGKKE